MTSLIEVQNLRVGFRMGKETFEAVRGVSFDIPANTTVALVGESGSGKSVSAMSIVRLLPPNAVVDPASRVLYNGVDLLQLPQEDMRRLRGIERPLANFFASGLFNLREKLGPILWQFPPNFRYEPERVEGFFRLLPRDTGEALTLGRRRDSRMTGRVRLAIDRNRPLRHAMEIRHESFLDESFVALLRRYQVALVIADTAGKWPCREDVTADFVYLRLHGDKKIYSSGYSDRALDRWAGRMRVWSEGAEPADARRISSEPARARVSRDVYCYFDNDIKVHAPFDAQRLIEKLALEVQHKLSRRRPRVRVPERRTSRRRPF